MKLQVLALLAVLLTMLNIKAQSAEINVVTELFYPYQQVDEDNQLKGYSVEVVEQLARMTGDALDIQILPWAVAYQVALETPDTMIFSIGRTPEREALFAWVGSLATESLHFWALSQSGVIESDSLSDFRQYRIAVVKEATTHQLLRASGFEKLYIMGGSESNVSEANRINMLIKNRADIIIAAETAMLPALKQLRLPATYLVRVHRARELDSELSLAFSKDSNPVLVGRYREALLQLRESGQMQQIQARWGIN
ncbi:substrate-binding periplasmic protein [Planctobacterium marinum]|uniref:substrate-binding periplasmic protein n=1 Tax=Planctobacterium marinum TaxID=1631968 RepID=UPI001E6117D7|nr:transporter substrate-binding domain-containing protein [Planctobacterium marinum]MCC2607538.1 transporter substrate-binding domain-containing protein [Planctobacterium marinum]